MSCFPSYVNVRLRFQSGSSSTEKSSKCKQSQKISGGVLGKAMASLRLPSLRPKSQPVRGCFHPGASTLSRESLPLGGAKIVSGQEMIKAMLRYIWPADDKAVRERVSLALGLLVGAKLMNIAVPFTFKYAVDYLNAGATLSMGTAPETVITVATSILLGCKLQCTRT